ncbi:MAG TPA: ATP-binding protein [Dehalococcoidia bacterium]|nr:ATP-binding protein [Dehalococcoidia bacterium]
MKEIVVLSGKGGTGKTTMVASFAALAKNKVLCDCDVDAADLHLLLKPKIKETHEFKSGQTAIINEKLCTRCGLCEEVCRFEAIKNLKVDPTACEGCGFCARVCPENAITMEENLAGHWFISDTKYGPLVHARLGIAQENSGKLVNVVRQNARSIVHKEEFNYIITDGPPGIGCPVISSLSGANLALLITEPTLSGMHDLERVIGVCQHFGVPALVCINKYDLNEENSQLITKSCLHQGIEVVSRIPYETKVSESIAEGVPLVEYIDNGASQEIRSLWQTLSNVVRANQ